MICFAVVAAIRPKPSGVSSYSPTLLPSSSSSAAKTVTWPFLRSRTHAGLVLGARGPVVRREEGLLDRLHQHVELDLLLLLEHPENVEVDVHHASFDVGRLNSIWTRALAMSA